MSGTLSAALADDRQRALLAVLLAGESTLDALAAASAIEPSRTTIELARLVRSGLVERAADAYHLAPAYAARLERELDALPAAAGAATLSDYDRRVLLAFLGSDGRLKAIPAQLKKREAVLRYLLQLFEPGQRYSERQVNHMLGSFHWDFATLRREMVAMRLMDREGGGGDYWRTA